MLKVVKKFGPQIQAELERIRQQEAEMQEHINEQFELRIVRMIQAIAKAVANGQNYACVLRISDNEKDHHDYFIIPTWKDRLFSKAPKPEWLQGNLAKKMYKLCQEANLLPELAPYIKSNSRLVPAGTTRFYSHIVVHFDPKQVLQQLSELFVAPEHRRNVAVYLAGSAIACVDYPPTGMVCTGATLRGDDHSLGQVSRELISDNRSPLTEEDMYRRVLIPVCSDAAQAIILGTKCTDSSNLDQAMRVALRIVLDNNKAISAKETIQKAESIVNATYEFARRYVTERRSALEAVAKALEAKLQLTGEAIIKIVEGFGKPSVESVSAEVKKIMAEQQAQGGEETDMSAYSPKSRLARAIARNAGLPVLSIPPLLLGGEAENANP